LKSLIILIFLILINLFVFVTVCFGQTSTESIDQLVSKCYDLYYSGLKEEAERNLIDALYDPNNELHISRLRYELGTMCFLNSNYEGASHQWDFILANDPSSEEAQSLRSLYSILNIDFSLSIKDMSFKKEIELSRRFWNRVTPNLTTINIDLADPIIALKYLNYLSQKYNGPAYKAVILYDKFLLNMGYNRDGFGFPCKLTNSDYIEQRYDKTVDYYLTATGDSNNVIVEKIFPFERKSTQIPLDEFRSDFRPTIWQPKENISSWAMPMTAMISWRFPSLSPSSERGISVERYD